MPVSLVPDQNRTDLGSWVGRQQSTGNSPWA